MHVPNVPPLYLTQPATSRFPLTTRLPSIVVGGFVVVVDVEVVDKLVVDEVEVVVEVLVDDVVDVVGFVEVLDDVVVVVLDVEVVVVVVVGVIVVVVVVVACPPA